MVAKQPKPRATVAVRAITPERDACEIRFPRVQGYRVELPEEHVDATFDDDSTLVLTPEIVGPSITHNAGIIGEGVDLSLIHRKDLRPSTLVYHLTKTLLENHWRDRNEEPKLHLFGQLKRVTRRWLDDHLVCKGGTYLPSSCTRSWRIKLVPALRAASWRGISASAPSPRCSTRTTRPARRCTSTSPPRSRPAGKPTRAAAT